MSNKLSNRAVPVYYEEFRDLVLQKEIPVCREILMEMDRIEALIASPRVYYDASKVEGFNRFCEDELTLTDGEPLVLLDTFKLWAEQVFGWWFFEEFDDYVKNDDGRGGHWERKTVKKRLTNIQYLIVARGAAKSLYESCIQNYGLNVDRHTTHQITTAPTMKQAEEIIGPIRTSITRARGPYFKFLTEGSLQNTTGSRALRQKLVPTKKGVENFLTGSLLEVRPMSIDKLQGLRSKYNTVDEWLSGDIREDVVEAIRQGAEKVPDWLIVAVSSEGTVRNGAGDNIKLTLQEILKGDYIAPEISIWHYKLDELEEIKNPDLWVKAQPNLGKTVSFSTYHKAVERAEKSPSQRNDILAKRFGIPMAGFTYFFTYEETLPHRKRKYWGLPCSVGADLSQGDDFCAFTFLFPLPNGKFGVKVRSYITERTMARIPGATRAKYDEFIDEGSLHVMPGTILDVDGVIFDDLDAHIQECDYDARTFGYDAYGAKAFSEKWEQMNGVYGMERVIQGARTESVPLGELKNLSEERLLLFDELLMQYCMGNAVVEEDTNYNRKLMKKRYDEKIDNVSALMDAFVAWKLNKEMFE
jgi:phage terminase large subunit-like protein